jgi:hypothetical protein
MKYLLLILLVSGCKLTCQDVTRTLELVPGDPFFDVNISLLDAYQKQGYDCDYVAIRDGFGRSIGDRWTCTKCA